MTLPPFENNVFMKFYSSEVLVLDNKVLRIIATG